ncbi:MAG: hypothetical protein ABEJ26_10090 [Halosimplex sp.]
MSRHRIRFESSSSPISLRLSDPVDAAEARFFTRSAPSFEYADIEYLQPVDDVVELVGVSELVTPYFVEVWVRDERGDLLADLSSDDELTIDTTPCYVEYAGLDLKVYVKIERGQATLTNYGDRVTLSLESANGVSIGARSFAEQPAGTITVPATCEGVATGLSYLGSALKTTSPERAWPTLRGHPPLIEVGSELSVPETVSLPETDVEIRTDRSLESLYAVAPLAYYLGATVSVAEEVTLVTGDREFPLDASGSVSRTATEYLQKALFFDCVVRTEGLYEVDLHERALVEERFDFDIAALYDDSLPAQLAQYLPVEMDRIDDLLPRWKTTMDITPTFEHASALPFAADELAHVRTPAAEKYRRPVSDGSGAARGPVDEPETEGEDEEDWWIFSIDETSSVEHMYLGPGVPISANKTSVETLYRRLETESDSSPQIEVAVVNNGEEMRDENVVSEVYGNRSLYRFDVSLYEDLQQAEVAELLASDIDFFHYIGHIDDEGLRCVDGHLDLRNLDTVGTDTFLLNGCSSARQAQSLVDNGAIGGLGTINQVISEAATEAGILVARLLDRGYSLLQTRHLLADSTIVGNYYIVLGDGSSSILHHEGGAALVATIETSEESDFAVTISSVARDDSPLGSMVFPKIAGATKRYLTSGELDTFHVTSPELDEFLLANPKPITVDNSLYWSEEISAGTVRDLLYE